MAPAPSRFEEAYPSLPWAPPPWAPPPWLPPRAVNTVSGKTRRPAIVSSFKCADPINLFSSLIATPGSPELQRNYNGLVYDLEASNAGL